MKTIQHPIIGSACSSGRGAVITSVLLSAFGMSAVEAPRDTTYLKDLIVTAPAKTDVTLSPLDVTVIDQNEMDRSTESSLLPIMVNKVPGLFVSERGFAGYGVSGGAAGTVNIRGVGQGNKVLFMIDGQPQWAGVFGHALPDTYVTNGVERIEVVKGPSSILYGSNAMGGSVNIITKKQRTDGYYGRARAMFGSFSTQKFNLSTGFRKGKFNGTVAGSVDRSNGNRKGSEFWLANELIQFQYTPSAHWETGFTVDMSQTTAHNPGTEQEPLESMWTNLFRGTASVYVRDNYEISKGGAQAFINWGRNKVDDGYAPGEAPTDYLFNSTDYNMGFTLFQTVNPWDGNDLSAGVDFLHWGGHNWNTGKEDPSVRSAEFRHHENEVGAYLMMQQDLAGDLLSLNAGIRMQHGSQYGNVLIPQAGFVLRAFKGNTLKFSWSKGFRAPNLRELYLYAPANPDLKPEYMWNYDVEWRQFFLDNRLNVGLSLFFIDGKDMIQVVRENGRPRNMNVGRFINKGFEVDASFSINPLWMVSANYSYLHTDAEIVSAPKNKLNAQLDFMPGNFDFSLESASIWGLYTGGSDKENYSLLNFRAAYTFRMKTDATFFVKVDNITDKHYEIVHGCPMPGTTLMGGVELRF